MLGNYHQTSCNECCSVDRIQGCVSGVPYLLVVNYGSTPATITNINLISGAVGSGTPVGFNAGDCPAVQDYEFQILCDAGNANTQFIRILSFNTQDGTVAVSNVALDGITAYSPVNPVQCDSKEKYDIVGPITYCDAGVVIYATEIWDMQATPLPVRVGVVYRNTAGSIITPSGSQVLGVCPSTFPSGAVSIASGTFATTLGPNGTTWTAPATLHSVTVRARRSNTTDARLIATNRVQVNFTSGSVVLLTNEILTWSVEDENRLGNIVSVQTFGNAAALINFN